MPIPYNSQNINSKDIANVVKVLRSNFITQGKETLKFENKLSKLVKSKYAVTTNSATSALLISLLSLGVKKGDAVWTVPITFAATSNAILNAGGLVDFVDIDLKNYNIDFKKLEEKIINTKISLRPKIVIPIHFAGNPYNMKELFLLSKKYNFKIIEDASHALGGKYKDTFIGSCKFSDITVFSTHAVKMITTGEGGVITTNKKNIYEKSMLLRSHGIVKDIKKMIKKRNPSFYYEQHDLGFNFRMTDFQAALGLSQLNRLKQFVKRRNLIAKNYNNWLISNNIEHPKIDNDNLSSFHLYVVLFRNKYTRDKVYNFLKKNHIYSNLHYIPVYLHPYYRKLGFNKNYCMKSEAYYQRALSLPIFVNLKENQQKKICKLILEKL